MNHIGTIELTTDRLTLRRFEVEDAASMFYNWAGDPEVTKYLTWPAYRDADGCEEYLTGITESYCNKDFYYWAIELNELEQPIGSISAVKVDEETDSVEIGYCIGKKFWHRGITTEAAAEIVRFFINQVGLSRVYAKHDTENIYSGKVMLNAGLEFEGILRHSGKNNRGIVDLAYYSKIRSAALDEADAAKEAGDLQSAENSAGGEAVRTGARKVLGDDGRLHNVISDETMEYVGILAKLELSLEEAEAARKDMADMLDYIDQLSELDTTGVEPMSHVFPVHNVFRMDTVENGDGSQAALSNAPVKKDGGFKVPKTIGE